MDELYRENILDHYKRPRHFGRPDEFDLEFEDTNPFCGDEQHVTIRLDEDDRVAEIAFDGKGCAISTAATSLLTDELEGMTREELIRLDKQFVLDLLGIDISEILDRHGVAVRAGHHCAQILMDRLGVAATARASFGVYTTTDEIDRLIDGLHDARRVFGID